MNMRHLLIALGAGALFGLGLGVSGMANPDKVLNFLDVSGHWDPSLALVMGGALLVAMPGFAWARRRARSQVRHLPPTDGPTLNTPSQRIDMRLLTGSTLFGIGWGIAGYCPGPALASLTASADAVAFTLALVAGSQLARPFQRRGG